MHYSKIKERVDGMFSQRLDLLSLWQHMAEHFYPERADFTTVRNIGDELADSLSTSYPILASRELGDVLSSMLRPRSQKWFSISIEDDEDLDLGTREWLERATKSQWRAMYDSDTNFVRALKQADRDFVVFGNAVISKEVNRKTGKLLYRNWHLRDVAWRESFDGKINEVCRKSSMGVTALMQEFDGKVSDKVRDMARKEPHKKVNIYHVVMPSDQYEDEKMRTPFVSIYMECDTGHILRKEPMRYMIYTIPRWQTVCNSPYAYSPATVAALPDSRLLQAMTLSLLEAGEMATNPPMYARQEVFRGDIQRYANGITYVDLEPEQKIQDALHFQPIDYNGISRGLEMREEIKAMIAKAFYLDRLNLPQAGNDMTAFEVSQRVTEYIRNALPLFEPLEQQYNAPICEDTFQILLDEGVFTDIPEELQGEEIQFKFESPLHEAIEKQKAQVFMEGSGLVAQAAAVDQNAVKRIDVNTALKDSLVAIGTPAKWLRDDDELEAIAEQEAQMQAMAQQIQLMQAGGEAAQAVGGGAQSLQQGGVI